MEVDDVVVIGWDAVEGFDFTIGGEQGLERVRNDTTVCLFSTTVVVDSSKDLAFIVGGCWGK